MAIPPVWPFDGRQHLLGLHVADVFEVVFQHALLGGDLRAGIQVLHAAAAADTEVRAIRRYAKRTRSQYLLHRRLVIVRLRPHDARHHRFAGQPSLDEYGLAVIAGDALAFVIGGFNVERDRHGRGPNGKVAPILGTRRASSPRADSGGAAAGT